MAGASPSSAGSSSWWVRSVKVGVNGRERRLKCRLWATNLFNKNKTNKNYPVGEKQAGWLAGWTGLDDI